SNAVNQYCERAVSPCDARRTWNRGFFGHLRVCDGRPSKGTESSTMIKTISYVGLGTMGSGMASNLLKAGYKLTVWNRNIEKCEPFARKGAREADTPANAVRDAELAMYSLSNDQADEEVVCGAEGVLSGIN